MNTCLLKPNTVSIICETERLVVRQFELTDADFIVELLNQESFIRFIGDKQVRSTSDAEYYLNKGPIASYNQYGFGLNLVALKECSTPIGMCGILKRDELDKPDLGYAFLPEYWGKGLAKEACEGVLNQEMARYKLETVLAITLPDNPGSNALLKSLGFRYSGVFEIYNSDNNLYRYGK